MAEKKLRVASCTLLSTTKNKNDQVSSVQPNTTYTLVLVKN